MAEDSRNSFPYHSYPIFQNPTFIPKHPSNPPTSASTTLLGQLTIPTPLDYCQLPSSLFPIRLAHLIVVCCCLVPMDSCSVHGISQARILDWVAISFSRGIFPTQGSNCVSCIGRQILYHWTREAHLILTYPSNLISTPSFQRKAFPDLPDKKNRQTFECTLHTWPCFKQWKCINRLNVK